MTKSIAAGSSLDPEAKEKQIGRYLRYKLAFERLDEALSQGWLLEAISLEESIITDRLIAVLDVHGIEVSPTQSLSNLIAQAKRHTVGSGERVAGDLFDEIDQWRDQRNECVHGFCKLDDHAYTDNSAEIFADRMWDTAAKGRELVGLARDLVREARKKKADKG
jgi:hypothetical protein